MGRRQVAGQPERAGHAGQPGGDAGTAGRVTAPRLRAGGGSGGGNVVHRGLLAGRWVVVLTASGPRLGAALERAPIPRGSQRAKFSGCAKDLPSFV
jgi:hypothetical protein